MYGVGGERWLPELIVPWLSGYENSSPVRIGNAPREQMQSTSSARSPMRCFRRERRAWSRPSAAEPCGRSSWTISPTAWRQPDEGHLGGARRAAALRSLEGHGLGCIRSRGAGAEAASIPRVRASVGARSPMKSMPKSVSADSIANSNSFVQAYGSKRLDASLLLIPLVGFLPADRSAVQGTLRAIEEKLLIERRIRSAVRNRKHRRWPARRRRSFFGVQLLVGRQLHIAGPLCGRAEAIRTFAHPLQ